MSCKLDIGSVLFNACSSEVLADGKRKVVDGSKQSVLPNGAFYEMKVFGNGVCAETACFQSTSV